MKLNHWSWQCKGDIKFGRNSINDAGAVWTTGKGSSSTFPRSVAMSAGATHSYTGAGAVAAQVAASTSSSVSVQVAAATAIRTCCCSCFQKKAISCFVSATRSTPQHGRRAQHLPWMSPAWVSAKKVRKQTLVSQNTRSRCLFCASVRQTHFCRFPSGCRQELPERIERCSHGNGACRLQRAPEKPCSDVHITSCLINSFSRWWRLSSVTARRALFSWRAKTRPTLHFAKALSFSVFVQERFPIADSRSVRLSRVRLAMIWLSL